MSTIRNLLREHLRGMRPYESARRSMSGGNIWLNANESPYSPACSGSFANLNRYPNFQSAELNNAYARYAKVSESSVMSHRGSDEAIDILIRAFCEPAKDKIMICPPTYGMYAISAGVNGNAVTSVPLLQCDNTWVLDVDNISNNLDNVKIVFICSPSNPLGNTVSDEQIQQVLEITQGKCLVVVDEAYIEYADSASATRFLKTYEHLIVTRTMSKAFGLAGIRVGFTLANSSIVEALTPVLAPYPLPEVSIQIATKALTADALIDMRQNVIEAQGERERLTSTLTTYSWVKRAMSSVTNFVLLQVDSAESLVSFLESKGILIRNQSAQMNLSNCVRITVGSPAENDALIANLNEYPGAKL